LFPVYDMKAYKGSGDIAPPFLFSALAVRNWSPSLPGRLHPAKNPVLIGFECECTTETVWAFWRTEISLALTEFQLPYHPARNPS